VLADSPAAKAKGIRRRFNGGVGFAEDRYFWHWFLPYFSLS
jgi:hypothetical protein